MVLRGEGMFVDAFVGVLLALSGDARLDMSRLGVSLFVPKAVRVGFELHRETLFVFLSIVEDLGDLSVFAERWFIGRESFLCQGADDGHDLGQLVGQHRDVILHYFEFGVQRVVGFDWIPQIVLLICVLSGELGTVLVPVVEAQGVWIASAILFFEFLSEVE